MGEQDGHHHFQLSWANIEQDGHHFNHRMGEQDEHHFQLSWVSKMEINHMRQRMFNKWHLCFSHFSFSSFRLSSSNIYSRKAQFIRLSPTLDFLGQTVMCGVDLGQGYL